MEQREFQQLMKLPPSAHRFVLPMLVIPVLLVVVAFALAAKSQRKPVPVASIRTGDTFDTRYGDLPPAALRIRTIPIVPQPPTPSAAEVPPPPVARPVVVALNKKPARRGDVCTRHGMRKVMVGRYKWRCRR